MYYVSDWVRSLKMKNYVIYCIQLYLIFCLLHCDNKRLIVRKLLDIPTYIDIMILFTIFLLRLSSRASFIVLSTLYYTYFLLFLSTGRRRIRVSPQEKKSWLLIFWWKYIGMMKWVSPAWIEIKIINSTFV